MDKAFISSIKDKTNCIYAVTIVSDKQKETIVSHFAISSLNKACMFAVDATYLKYRKELDFHFETKEAYDYFKEMRPEYSSTFHIFEKEEFNENHKAIQDYLKNKNIDYTKVQDKQNG